MHVLQELVDNAACTLILYYMCKDNMLTGNESRLSLEFLLGGSDKNDPPGSGRVPRIGSEAKIYRSFNEYHN